MKKRAALSLGLCVFLVACAQQQGEQPNPYKPYVPPEPSRPKPSTVHIESEPPGAKIEINDELVGTTPCDVGWPNGGQSYSYKVVANPVAAGEYTQVKTIFPDNNGFPAKLYFDMSLVRDDTPSVDVNVHNY